MFFETGDTYSPGSKEDAYASWIKREGLNSWCYATLIIYEKYSILDDWKGSEYACEVDSSSKMSILPPSEAPFY